MTGTVGPRGTRDLQQISKVTLSEIVGLLKAANEMGGQAEVAKISQQFDMALDRLPAILSAAQFLGLASVAEGEVTVTDLGRRVVAANLRQRKVIVREVIRELPLFQKVTDMIRRSGRPLARQELLGVLAESFGTHQADGVFNALVYWGRYAEFLSYDSRVEQLSLRP